MICAQEGPTNQGTDPGSDTGSDSPNRSPKKKRKVAGRDDMPVVDSSLCRPAVAAQDARCQHQAAQAQISAPSAVMPALALPPAPPEQKPATSLAAQFAARVEQRQQDRMAAIVAKVFRSQQLQAQQPQQLGAAGTGGWQSIVLVMHCYMVHSAAAT